MREEEFKKLDETWMKELEGLRREPLPPHLTKGFTESVETKIRAGKDAAPKRPWMQWHVPAQALVPAFAVLVLAVTVTLRSLPGPVSKSADFAPGLARDRGTIEIAAVEPDSVDETVALLAALGELEAEDAEDAAAIEQALDELEVSRGDRFSATV